MDDQISRGVPHGGVPPGARAGPTGASGDDDGAVAATFCATLVDEWVRAGVRHAVVSPGSRSTPITVALDDDDRVRLHLVHDERSAGFTALGMALATGRPSILACTSGTAAVHFHAAVVEADLAAVPLIVVTADRPPELQGVLAPQTINQRDLYGKAPRWYCEPGPPTAGGAPWWRDLARDALDRAEGNLPGPVHLDLAFREPLSGAVGELPPEREPVERSVKGSPWVLTDEDVARLAEALAGRRGLIVAGVRAAADEAETAALWELADVLRWPVLADAPSGMRVPRDGLVTTSDLLLRHPGFADEHRPEVVVRLGGLLSSKVTAQFLATSTPTQFGFDRFGRCPDPDRVLSATFAVNPSDAARSLLAASPAPAPVGWRSGWVEAESIAREAVALAADRGGGRASEPTVALDVFDAVPSGGNLMVSSSMPVRDLEWFAGARSDVHVYANRGANGIDGITSTAVGIAAAGGRPTVLLTGDVAFLHDVSSLTALRQRRLEMTIVVVDNDGGGIFGFLPQADQLGPAQFERLFGTPHGTDTAAVAKAFGLPTESVNSRAGLQAALAGSIARGGTRVIVVRTDRQANVAEHRRFQQAVAGALDSAP